MTRTHKNNDVPHNNPEAETAFQEHKIPKYFGKNGFTDQAPNKVKKNGGGKGNWGHDGGELQDLEEYNTFKQRRRSNSMGHVEGLMVSKFEKNDDEPVFDEEEEAAIASTATTASASSAKA